MSKDLFINVPSTVGMLLSDVKSGIIGLPDLQRPYVWADKKIRELLDSMMKGYPIGYIMLWDSPADFQNKKVLGKDSKVFEVPEDLVIDGQQRLTGLLSAMYGIPIIDKNYKERTIRISYNPLTRTFAVWTMAYERNKEWISTISEVFEADSNHELSKYRRQYIKALDESREKNGEPLLTDDEKDLIEDNLKLLLDLDGYSLPTMRILENADEEDVAEIFVRVNSGGQKLNEKNFIETLLSVFDIEIHKKINSFCEKSRQPADGTAFNHILKADPSHLIRMAVGFGFRRARLKYAYMLLRGKDLQRGAGGAVTKERRDQNLEIFRKSLDKVTNLNNWHAIMNIFKDTGYVDGKFVASSNAVVYSYVLYLIGKYEYKVPTMELLKIMKKWIFMATLTQFYTGSTETEVEKQFNDLKEVKSAQEFVNYLDSVISDRLTSDFFRVTLPNQLVTSSSQSPIWYGYVASINIIGNPILFGTSPQAALLIPGTSGTKTAADVHHIFPKAYLVSIGIDKERDINQIANYTYLDYQTNIDIGDSAPAEYAETYRDKLGEEQFLRTCRQNAIPDGFDSMKYQEFLEHRRKAMSLIVQSAYEKLCE